MKKLFKNKTFIVIAIILFIIAAASNNNKAEESCTHDFNEITYAADSLCNLYNKQANKSYQLTLDDTQAIDTMYSTVDSLYNILSDSDKDMFFERYYQYYIICKRLNAQEHYFIKHTPSEFAIDRTIKTILKDPDSYQGISYSPFHYNSDNGIGYLETLVKYRAKNSFGGYVVEYILLKYDISNETYNIIR